MWYRYIIILLYILRVLYFWPLRRGQSDMFDAREDTIYFIFPSFDSTVTHFSLTMQFFPSRWTENCVRMCKLVELYDAFLVWAYITKPNMYSKKTIGKATNGRFSRSKLRATLQTLFNWATANRNRALMPFRCHAFTFALCLCVCIERINWQLELYKIRT